MTVAELSGRMGHREFREWTIEYRLREEDRERRRMEQESGHGAEERARNPRRRR